MTDSKRSTDAPPGSFNEQTVEDTQPRFQVSEVDHKRLAMDTADYLIVNDEIAASSAAPPPRHADVRLGELRDAVDTGEYAVNPSNVAEAMVKRVKRMWRLIRDP